MEHRPTVKTHKNTFISFKTISLNNVLDLTFTYTGQVGTWHSWQLCQPGEHVIKFNIRHVYDPIASVISGDYVGLTGLRLRCQSGSPFDSQPDFSSGSWKTATPTCAGGYSGARLKIALASQGYVSKLSIGQTTFPLNGYALQTESSLTE